MTASQKHLLRRETLRRRDAIPHDIRRIADREIMLRLMAESFYQKAGLILFYASFRSEVNTLVMIEEALRQGKHVALPRVNPQTGTLSKHRINDLREVSPGHMGIPEPEDSNHLKVEQMDLLIIPGAAFSPEGVRIGYGGGFYDKLLPRIKGTVPIVALAYEEQIHPALPCEAHDIPVDYIITGKRTINCRESSEVKNG